MKILKIGLDVHGVINKDPAFFSVLSNRLIKQCHEVHLLTGKEIGSILAKEIVDSGVSFTKLFSITTYHKSIGTYVAYKDGNPEWPMIAPPKWDRTKADYCAREGIDIMIDDSEIYGKYFEGLHTQYLLWTPQLRWFLLLLAGM